MTDELDNISAYIANFASAASSTKPDETGAHSSQKLSDDRYEESEEDAEEEDEDEDEDEEDDMPELDDEEEEKEEDTDEQEEEEEEEPSKKRKKKGESKKKKKAKQEKVNTQAKFADAKEDGTFCIGFVPLATDGMCITGLCWAKTVVVSDLDLINAVAKQSTWHEQRHVETPGHCHEPAKIALLLAKKKVSVEEAHAHRQSVAQGKLAVMVPFFVSVYVPAYMIYAVMNPMLMYRVRVRVRDFKLHGESASAAFVCPQFGVPAAHAPIVVTKEEAVRYTFDRANTHCIAGLPTPHNSVGIFDFCQLLPMPAHPSASVDVPVRWAEADVDAGYGNSEDEIGVLFGSIWKTPASHAVAGTAAVCYRPFFMRKYALGKSRGAISTQLVGPAILKETLALAPNCMRICNAPVATTQAIVKGLRSRGHKAAEEACLAHAPLPALVGKWLAASNVPQLVAQCKPPKITPGRLTLLGLTEKEALVRASLSIGALLDHAFWAVCMHTSFHDALDFERKGLTATAYRLLVCGRVPAELLFQPQFDEMLFAELAKSCAEAMTPLVANMCRQLHCRDQQVSPYDAPPLDLPPGMLNSVASAFFAWKTLKWESEHRVDAHFVIVAPRIEQPGLFADSSLSVRTVGDCSVFTTRAVDSAVGGFERVLAPDTGPFARHGVDVVRIETRRDHDDALLRACRRSSRMGARLVVLCVTAHALECARHLLGDSEDLIFTDGTLPLRLDGAKAHLCVPFAHEIPLLQAEALLQSLTASLFKIDAEIGSETHALMLAHRGDAHALKFDKIRALLQRSVAEGACGDLLTVIGLPLSPWSPFSTERRTGPSLVDDLYFLTDESARSTLVGFATSAQGAPFLRAFGGQGELVRSIVDYTANLDALGVGTETAEIGGGAAPTSVTCHVRRGTVAAASIVQNDSAVLWPGGACHLEPRSFGDRNSLLRAAPFELETIGISDYDTVARAPDQALVVFDSVPANSCITAEWPGDTQLLAYKQAAEARKAAQGIDKPAAPAPCSGTMFDTHAEPTAIAGAPTHCTFMEISRCHELARVAQSGFALSTLLGVFFLERPALTLFGSISESIVQRLQARVSRGTPNWFFSYAACTQSPVPYVLRALVSGRQVCL